MLASLVVALSLTVPPPAFVGSAASEPVAGEPTDGAATSAPPARDPAVHAAELFRDGRYAEAAAAFEEAHRQTNDPAFLFGRAQALRRGGNCFAAIEVFEQFIASSPPEPDVQEARRVIAACREILGEGRPEPEPAIEPLPPDPTLEPAPEPTDRPQRPWHRDVAGGVLLGTGLALGVSGGAVYGAAFGRAGDRSESESQYESRDRSVRNLTITGASLLAVGGVVLVGAVVRYVIVARRSGRRGVARVNAPLQWQF